MIDPTTGILSAILISIISGIVGKSIGGNNKVTEAHCNEKQVACNKLLVAQIVNLEKKIDSLTTIVNNKFLGI